MATKEKTITEEVRGELTRLSEEAKSELARSARLPRRRFPKTEDEIDHETALKVLAETKPDEWVTHDELKRSLGL